MLELSNPALSPAPPTESGTIRATAGPCLEVLCLQGLRPSNSPRSNLPPLFVTGWRIEGMKRLAATQRGGRSRRVIDAVRASSLRVSHEMHCDRRGTSWKPDRERPG